MKKFLLVSLGVMILSMAMVGAASANGGPHGNYDAMTDKCAGCHRAHTAKGNYLLVGANEYDFCMTCHGAGTTGAGTNVAEGKYDGAGATPMGTEGRRLNGGGFESIVGTTTTSKHNVLGDGEVGTAWGGGTGQNLTASLECTSCHNPHGNTSYRMLKNSGSVWTTGAAAWTTVPFSPYDVSANGPIDSSSRGYTWVADKMDGKAIGSKNPDGTWKRIPTNIIQANYGNDISNFCGACHTKYVGPSGYWRTPWTTAGITVQGEFQQNASAHRSMSSPSNLPAPTANAGYPSPIVFAQSTNVSDGQYSQVCLTCHFAHGTTAQMSGWAVEDVDGGSNPNHVGFTGGSANLFYDNRGICEQCHRK